MNIRTTALLFSVLLLHTAHCSAPSQFHYSSEWDESVLQCLGKLGGEVPDCGDYVLDKLSKPQLQAVAYGDNKALKAVIRRFCLSYETNGQICFQNYLKWITPCLNETQLHREKNFIRMVHASWRTLCSTEGWHSIKHFSKSTVQCVQHRSYGLLHCLQILQLKNFSEVQDYLTNLLLDGECSTYDEGTTCILKELQQCSDQSAALIMQREFEELLNISPCRYHQQHNSSTEHLPDQNIFTRDIHQYNGTAVAEISSNNHHVNEMVQENEAVEYADLVPDELIQKCLDNGDNEAYQRAQLSRQKLTQCGSALLHTDKLLQEVRAAILSNGQGMGPIVKRFCKEYQTSGRYCLNQYLSNLTPCLNETQKQIEELVVKMVETSWEYSCQKDAFLATLFMKNSTLSCVEMQSPGLIECIVPYLDRLRSAGDPTRAVAKVLVNKECSLYASVTQCIVSSLQQCPDQVAAEIVSGSFNETLRISPCAGYKPPTIVKLVKEDPSQLIPGFLQFEAKLQKLEETINREQAQQEATRNAMLAALEQQTKLLKQMSTSLEVVVSLVKQGKGRKLGHTV
ncbi:uncharacterized protein [Anabrus simplex]|uniref:uncharacterized protein n=1 Tax=Anabrus simplex TaxID=316456 RepID=UPI0035A28A13